MHCEQFIKMRASREAPAYMYTYALVRLYFLLDQDQTYEFLCVDLLPSKMYMLPRKETISEQCQSLNILQVTLLVCCSFCKEST